MFYNICSTTFVLNMVVREMIVLITFVPTTFVQTTCVLTFVLDMIVREIVVQHLF